MEDKCYMKEVLDRSSRGRRGCTPVVLLLLLLIFVGACATKTKVEYVDREVVKYQVKIQHDTLVNNTHDSIYHTVFQKGDTVFDTKFVAQIKYKYITQNKCDTLWRDSVRTEFKEVTVEKKVIPKWCFFSLIGCAAFVVLLFIKIKKWLKF